jgi:L-2,4-diaminobutyrate transaminase
MTAPGLANRDPLESADRDHLFHPSTAMGAHARGETPARIIESGQGVTVVDREGRESLDAFAGLYCVNVGYGRMEIAEAIAEQARKLAYYHSYAGHGNEPAIRLAEMIIERAPAHMSRVYFGLSGSDANETNIKLVWYLNNVLGRPEKKKIISRWRGYHGSGIMTGSLTGLEEMIIAEGPGTVAAFIGEPVLGTGGIVPPPAGYWQKIQAVLEKYDVLLIADEVVTGFGRLGAMFGSDHYAMTPDIITIAKGLTSAYAPLSGSIVSDKVWQVLEQGSDQFGVIGHGWTYSAHPLCAAAGVANLELIDTLGLVDNAREVGAYFNGALEDALADHPMVGDVRGAGLLAAVEFVADKAERRLFDPALKVGPQVAAAAVEQGLIARAMPQGDILGFAPPLCLTRDEADRIVAMTKAAVEAVAPRVL